MEAVSSVGLCNTQLTAKNGRSPAVEEWGIDTWRLGRYLDSDEDLGRAVRFLHGRTFQKVEGHSLGVMPDRRFLWIEGHPAVDGLAPPKTLRTEQDRVLAGLEDHGLPIGRQGGIRRFDQTVTLRFQEPAEGMAFLQGMAAVDVPRTKPASYGRPIETVYLLGLGRKTRRVLARCYDKGIEAGTARRGELIRLENQTRCSKDSADYINPETMSEFHHLAGSHFAHRFAPVAESVNGVHAATAPVLADRVAELIADGRMSASKGTRLLGYLVAGQRLDGSVPERTLRRWRHELREYGLVLVDPLADQIDVDLGDALWAAVEAWSGDAA